MTGFAGYGMNPGDPVNTQAPSDDFSIIKDSVLVGMVQSTLPLGCSMCGNTKSVMDSESGETICSGCGMVMSEKAENMGSDKISDTFDKHNKNARTGSPMSVAMHDMGLSTVIGRSDSDSAGSPLKSSMKPTMGRLRMLDGRSKEHKTADRNFRRAFSEIRRLKERLRVPDAVMERAAYFYRKIYETDMIRGRTINSFAAAAMYAACRESGTVRSLSDVQTASNIGRKVIGRHYMMLVDALGLVIPQIDPIQSIAKIASVVGTSEKIRRYAIRLLEQASKSKTTAGKRPECLAAGALYASYLHHGEYTTQDDIASAAGISTVTLRHQQIMFSEWMGG